MSDSWQAVITAMVWGAGGALLAWLLTWPLRSRTTVGGYISIVAVATVATLAAVLGNIRAMLIDMSDQYVVVISALVAGFLASLTALLVARTFRRERLLLRGDVAAIGAGRPLLEMDSSGSSGLTGLRRELRDMNAALAAARDRERAIEQSRRELVSWISHDLRTPLAGIRAMSEALEDGVAASPKAYQQQMKVEVDRLVDMVDDLFQLSRLHAGGIATARDRLNLADLVSDTIAGLTPVARLLGVDLQGSAPSVVDVLGDGSQLNRALTNLVYNAIRHTAADGTVRIDVERHGDARIAVRIIDECGGIAQEEISKVFDVGYRGEVARPPARGLGSGAGLGLAISREIAAAHRGTLEVENRGAGCVFTLLLPTVAAA